ncbi:hypothetical protein IH982_02145 [Patescibacteria group bacterium]|nr:hypothetical protein [Patescibacteria group bacterium]
MRSKTKKVIIIILILGAALILGNVVGISFKQFQQQEEKKTGEGEIGQPAPSSSVSPEIASPTRTRGDSVPLIGELSLLPTENASEEEKTAFNAQMGRLTVETNTMEIGEGCVLTPLVVRPLKGLPFTFKSTASVDHLILVGDKNVFVAAGEEKSIDTQFPNGPGWYGISCGESRNIVGYMEMVGSPETAPQ